MSLFPAKPRIIQAPADLIANEGRSATFTCIADGDPQPTVFWEREGKASSTMLPNMYYYGRRFFVSRLGESLKISKVEKEDEGVYTCLALSQIGNSHAKAKLTVIGKDVFVVILFSVTTKHYYICSSCVSILSLVQILFSFVFGYGNV